MLAIREWCGERGVDSLLARALSLLGSVNAQHVSHSWALTCEMASLRIIREYAGNYAGSSSDFVSLDRMGKSFRFVRVEKSRRVGLLVVGCFEKTKRCGEAQQVFLVFLVIGLVALVMLVISGGSAPLHYRAAIEWQMALTTV